MDATLDCTVSACRTEPSTRSRREVAEKVGALSPPVATQQRKMLAVGKITIEAGASINLYPLCLIESHLPQA